MCPSYRACPEWRRAINAGCCGFEQCLTLMDRSPFSMTRYLVLHQNLARSRTTPQCCVNVPSKSSSDEVVWRHLADSGYVAIEQPRAKLILDVGEVGPAISRAPCGYFSFELVSLVRVFVNSEFPPTTSAPIVSISAEHQLTMP